jgi:hypothetical protein
MRARTLLAASVVLVAACGPLRAADAQPADSSAASGASANVPAARTRLDAAVASSRRLRLRGAAHEERGSLVEQAGALRREAALSKGKLPPADLAARMDATSEQLEALATRVEDDEPSAPAAPAPAQPASDESIAAGGLLKPDVPILDVNAFHDVAEDALSVLGGLSPAERRRVREVIQEGEEGIARVKTIGDSDHVARESELRHVNGLTRELQELHQAGMSDRRVGIPFVEARSAASGWTTVDQAENGFEVVRVRFVRPGSAHVTVRNATGAKKPLFVELEFTDMTGAPTGSAAYQTAALEEVAPDEVREVLVPIAPTHERFWDVTEGFTVHVE